MAGKLFNKTQAAGYLRIDAARVAGLARSGELPISGGTPDNPLFNKEELDAWASRRILGMTGKRLDSYNREAETRSGSPGEEPPFSLCDFISQERIFTAIASKTKASLLQDVTQCAADLGLLYDPRDLLDSLRAREEIASTALEGGVAIVHPRNHDPYLASESFILVAKTIHPVHFGAPDGKPTDIFFVLVCQDDRNHLRALARLCLMFSRTIVLDTIRAAETEDEILSAIFAAEKAVI